VNQATIGPIVFFVGLMINEEALNFMPSRHYAAYIIGLFPSIYDWVVNISGQSPIQDQDTGYNIAHSGSDSWYGVLAWKRGSLLVSMVWTAIIVMVIDRRWIQATSWATVGAALSAFGIIHAPVAGFENFSSPVWEQCSAATGECWEYGEQWMFMTAYLMLAATFLLILGAKMWGDATIGDALDDESHHAFDDWFKEADIDTSNHYKASTRNLAKTIKEPSDDDKEEAKEEDDDDDLKKEISDEGNESDQKEVEA